MLKYDADAVENAPSDSELRTDDGIEQAFDVCIYIYYKRSLKN